MEEAERLLPIPQTNKIWTF